MKKNAFTLIELLAVIVILAIIALIAVPILVNIINDSKEESLQRSIDLYIDHVQKTITKYQMTHPGFNPSTCTIQENGNVMCGDIEIVVEMKGQVPESGTIKIENNKITYDVELEGMEYVLNSEGVKTTQPAPAKATDEDYRGYYADVDGDGEPDGVIYADLGSNITYPQSGEWGPYNNGQYARRGAYSYTAETNLKKYTISENKYTGEKAKFGEKEIISVKSGSSRNSRFYVMALEDFTTEENEDPNDSNNNYPAYTGYYWYRNAYGLMSTHATDTSEDFGTGYTNTGKIIEIWNKNGIGDGSYTGAMQDNQDIFKHIQIKYQEGWYIPSRGEWAAFADYLSSREENPLTSDYNPTANDFSNNGNYDDIYGLSGYYWSSSQTGMSAAWYVRFFSGNVANGIVNSIYSVRLGVTF